jgi:hypothetical protein
MSSSHLLSGLPIGRFSKGFPIKILYAFLVFSILATILSTLGGLQKSRTSLLCGASLSKGNVFMVVGEIYLSLVT